MNESIIYYKHGAIAALHIRFFGILLVIIGLVIFYKIMALSIILILIGLVIAFSNSGVIINLENNTFQEYNSFFFFKTGENERFDKIDLLYINKNNKSQQMNSPRMTQTHVMKYVQYDAYIKFDNGDKLHLLTEKDKAKLFSKLEPVVKHVGIPITDNTQE